MDEVNSDLELPTAAAEVKIQIRPIGSMTASLQLPGVEAREMLRALTVGAAMAYGTVGPVVTMWVGSTQNVPLIATIGIACLEVISASVICWKALFRRRP